MVNDYDSDEQRTPVETPDGKRHKRDTCVHPVEVQRVTGRWIICTLCDWRRRVEEPT